MAKSLFTLLLTVLVLFVTAFPVQAAELDSSNTIEITCDFDDTADAEVYPATIYEVSIDGQYLVAEYNESDNSYIVTGYTSWSTGATRFRFGNNTEQPEKLIISNLPNGTYHFEESKRSDGYTNAKFDVTFSPEGFIVNDTETPYQFNEAGKLGEVRIGYWKPFDIPTGEPLFDDGTILGLTAIAGCSLCLIILLISSKITNDKEENK